MIKMLYFISIVHILTCVFIVLFILLQDPKGGVLGNLGGGGSKSLFGSQGAGGFLVNATKWLAIVFALTSLTLSYISSQKNKASLMEESVSTETPKNKTPENPSPQKTPESAPKNPPPASPQKGKPPENSSSLQIPKNEIFQEHFSFADFKSRLTKNSVN